MDSLCFWHTHLGLFLRHFTLNLIFFLGTGQLIVAQNLIFGRIQNILELGHYYHEIERSILVFLGNLLKFAIDLVPSFHNLIFNRLVVGFKTIDKFAVTKLLFHLFNDKIFFP